MRQQGWIRAFITMLLVIILIPAFGSINITNANPQPQAFSATIQPLGGVVQRQTQGGAWQDVTKVTLLQSGDTLHTGAEGAAEVSTVTGIKVAVHPSTEIQLDTLSMNSGDAGGQNFSMSQTVGLTYVTVDQKLKAQDNIEFFTPSGRMVIHGTKFYIFVGISGRTSVIGEESVVTVEDFSKQRFENGPDNITFIDMGDLAKVAAVCSAAFLKDNGKGHMLSSAQSATDVKALVKFLQDFLRTDVTDAKVKFIAGLLGMPDSSTPEELLAALEKYEKPVDLKDVLKQIRIYLSGNWGRVSGKPLATTDKMDKVSCGNGICETQAHHESLLSCPVDCIPGRNAVRACIRTIRDLFHPGHGGGNGGGVSTQQPTTPPINTPVPSGVG